MLKELFDAVKKTAVQEAAIQTIEIDGHTYTNRGLNLIDDPDERAPIAVHLSTLAGLVDFIKINEKREENLIIHIVSPTDVHLTSRLRKRNDRYNYAITEHDYQSFHFGNYLPLENFVIALQSQFVRNDDIQQLLDWLGNLANESVIENKDDGFSQSINIRTGITTKSRVKIENPITLQPYRTFLEVEQPAGAYIFRVKKSDKGELQCALFTAEGGFWKLVAIDSIYKWLRNALPEHTIIR